MVGIVESGNTSVRVDDGDFGNPRRRDLLDNDDRIADCFEDRPVVRYDFESDPRPARIGAAQEIGKFFGWDKATGESLPFTGIVVAIGARVRFAGNEKARGLGTALSAVTGLLIRPSPVTFD